MKGWRKGERHIGQNDIGMFRQNSQENCDLNLNPIGTSREAESRCRNTSHGVLVRKADFEDAQREERKRGRVCV